MTQNEKDGVFVPKKQVRKNLLKEMAEEVRKDLADLSSVYSDENALLKREQLYKKNMGITNWFQGEEICDCMWDVLNLFKFWTCLVDRLSDGLVNLSLNTWEIYLWSIFF